MDDIIPTIPYETYANSAAELDAIDKQFTRFEEQMKIILSTKNLLNALYKFCSKYIEKMEFVWGVLIPRYIDDITPRNSSRFAFIVSNNRFMS
jgi:hypothetical protein